jgi:hypothetical protein
MAPILNELFKLLMLKQLKSGVASGIVRQIAGYGQFLGNEPI